LAQAEHVEIIAVVTNCPLRSSREPQSLALYFPGGMSLDVQKSEFRLPKTSSAIAQMPQPLELMANTVDSAFSDPKLFDELRSILMLYSP
jgi:hypothetical protein